MRDTGRIFHHHRVPVHSKKIMRSHDLKYFSRSNLPNETHDHYRVLWCIRIQDTQPNG